MTTDEARYADKQTFAALINRINELPFEDCIEIYDLVIDYCKANQEYMHALFSQLVTVHHDDNHRAR